jgi:hypothetical protein
MESRLVTSSTYSRVVWETAQVVCPDKSGLDWLSNFAITALTSGCAGESDGRGPLHLTSRLVMSGENWVKPRS